MTTDEDGRTTPRFPEHFQAVAPAVMLLAMGLVAISVWAHVLLGYAFGLVLAGLSMGIWVTTYTVDHIFCSEGG